MVGRNLRSSGGLREPMKLIQRDTRAAQALQECLGMSGFGGASPPGLLAGLAPLREEFGAKRLSLVLRVEPVFGWLGFSTHAKLAKLAKAMLA
jgi:hypothetical protein